MTDRVDTTDRDVMAGGRDTSWGPSHGYAAVLVDVVASRDHPDRASLQTAVVNAADAVEQLEPALDPFTATVGDELQGTYAGILAAVRAIARLRLLLVETADVRAAIGWGDIEIHDPDRSPFGQDGSAWWAARDALDGLDRTGVGRLGVAYAEPASCSDGTRGGLPAPAPLDAGSLTLVRSHLRLLDHALARLDAVEAHILLGDLDGRPTDEIASEVGISASGVSQRRRRNNLRGLAAAIAMRDSTP